MTKFCGAIPALVTPLKADETLNAPVLRELMEDLLRQGADGFYIGGATGEGISLKREVREELAYEAVTLAKGKVPSIVHVASANFHEAIELAKQAERCGADGISAIPPLFFAYDEDDVYNYYKELASSVHIPLMIYYSPMAKFPISAKFAARMFEIDNVTAIKWTSSDYYGMQMLKDMTHGEMNIINGADEMLLMGLNAGADGGIGTTYNIMQPTIKKIYESFLARDTESAQAAQMHVVRVVEALLRYEGIPATKAVLEEIGYDVGNSTVPMKKYSTTEKREIFEAAKKVGFVPVPKGK